MDQVKWALVGSIWCDELQSLDVGVSSEEGRANDPVLLLLTVTSTSYGNDTFIRTLLQPTRYLVECWSTRVPSSTLKHTNTQITYDHAASTLHTLTDLW